MEDSRSLSQSFKLTRMSKILFSGKDSRVTTVVATPGYGPDRQEEVQYTETKVIGNGSFGVVYSAKLVQTSEMVAIKKVLQDKRFKVGISAGIGSDSGVADPDGQKVFLV